MIGIAMKGRSEMTSTDTPTKPVVFSGRTHAKILVGPIIIQAILLATHLLINNHLPEFGNETVDQWVPLVLHGVLALLQLIYVIIPVLRWALTMFTITEYSVKMSRGVFHREVREIRLSNVTQVEMQRSLFDYLFGCGTIVLHEASDSDAVRMVDVPKVVTAKQTLDRLIQAGHGTRATT